jgi:uncharacterized protein (TIGR03083 family)
MDEISTLIGTERTKLLTVLEGLDAPQWDVASLCDGWRVRDVVVHLLMAYELSLPRFLVKLAAAGFTFDTMADRWARGDSRPGSRLVADLRATAHRRFGVPGAPAEAPLSHLVCHAEDIYRPLGTDHRLDPRAALIVLGQLTSPRVRGSLPAGLLDGLTFTASDVPWSHGTGAEVVGSARALITTIGGRRAALGELTGGGVTEVRRRLPPNRAPSGPPTSA